MIEISKAAKDALIGIDGINTVAIGIEPNLSPKDYPVIRIVPVDSKPDKSISEYKNVSIDIYVGIAHKTDKDGYESIYETLEVWENEIKERLNTSAENAVFMWKSTRQDEDRLQNVKVIVLRFDAIG